MSGDLSFQDDYGDFEDALNPLPKEAFPLSKEVDVLETKEVDIVESKEVDNLDFGEMTIKEVGFNIQNFINQVQEMFSVECENTENFVSTEVGTELKNQKHVYQEIKSRNNGNASVSCFDFIENVHQNKV
jgi:hypothetical protein